MSGYLFKLRRGTATQWTTKDPVLRDGEPGFETDTGRLKVGDGGTAWTDLPYVDEAGLAEKADAAETAAALATKANASTVGALSARVDTTETRVGTVEDELGGRLSETALSSTLVQRVSRTNSAPALGLYFPEAHGATGDGATDDTAAVQAAIDAIQAAGGGTLHLAPKTYVVSSVDVQAGLTIMGYGATFKRPANTPNWTRTITNQNRKYSGTGDSTKPIVIKGLTVDGNLSNQGAYTGYELEQAALLFFSGTTTDAGREVVVVEDVTVTGSPADGVHITANVDATIRNLRGVDCFRGALTLTGGHSKVRASGVFGGGSVVGAHLDMEVDSPGFGGTYRCDLTLTDAEFTTPHPTAAQVQLSARGGAKIELRNVTMSSGLYVSGGSSTTGTGTIRLRNCDISTYQNTDRNQINNPFDVEFEDCVIRSNNPTGAVATVKAFNVVMNLSSTGPTGCHLRFTRCRFVTGTTVSGDTTVAVYNNSEASSEGNRITLDGGSIAAGYTRGLWMSQGGDLTVRGRTRLACARGIHAARTASREYRLTVEAVEVEATCTTYLYLENANAASTVRHQGTILDEAVNNLGTVSGLGANSYQGSRTILLTAAPTTGTDGLVGDIARLKTPVAGSVFEWLCTASSETSTTWKALTTAAA